MASSSNPSTVTRKKQSAATIPRSQKKEAIPKKKKDDAPLKKKAAPSKKKDADAPKEKRVRKKAADVLAVPVRRGIRKLKTAVAPSGSARRGVLCNNLVKYGAAMRDRFAASRIRYLCLMHVDPGFRNGNNSLLVVDMLHPHVNILLSFKVDLYGERNMPRPTRADVVDRMVDRLIDVYPRMYRGVHLCSIETQLERTAHEYADTKAEHMSTAIHALMRAWGTPVQHFDVGIVHRMLPDIYTAFCADSGKSAKQNAAAAYAHNKRCSSQFMQHSPALHEFERELVAMDMVDHAERRLRNGVTGETGAKWDDYGDGAIPAFALASYMCDAPLLEGRAADNPEGRAGSNGGVLYAIVFPSCPFVAQDIGVHREGDDTLLLLKHEAFPFMPLLHRGAARRVLHIDDPIRYSSWNDLTMELRLCIVDLTEK